MQILITHGSLAQTRVLSFNRLQIFGVLCGLLVLLTLVSATVYHFIFVAAAREDWPVMSEVVRLVVRKESAQRDRFMRENLDAIAQRVGEMQAKVVKLGAVSERVSDLAGVKPQELEQVLNSLAQPRSAGAPRVGRGGPLIPSPLSNAPSLQEVDNLVVSLDEAVDLQTDIFTLAESRLFEARMQALMIPNIRPVAAPVGSGFGFRSDPFTGRPALHTGLDFTADTGTPILAAAGGVVRSAGLRSQYGLAIDLDHGNHIVTRYAHTSKILVKAGDLVKRGQRIAAVGTSGRSTGPHLHFEVLLAGVAQNPARFLASAANAHVLPSSRGIE